MEISSAIEKQIEKEYKRIGERYVSIRSSATIEDPAQSTFAGLHSTFLFRKGINIILANIKRCWASLYTHRAITHRNKFGIEEKNAKMAVIVAKDEPELYEYLYFYRKLINGQKHRQVVSKEEILK